MGPPMLKAPPVFQKHLEKVLEELFPSENIPFPAINTSFTLARCAYLEVDIWYPQLNIGFEFQDEHHYKNTWYSHSPLDVVQQKDYSKQKQLQEQQKTLVHIPCWWDGTLPSLLATIQFHRPDLLPGLAASSIQIPLNPPYDFFDRGIPGVGQLMLASFPADYQPTEDISADNPWWMGEKYDGIRCCWNPNEKQFGIPINIPLLGDLLGPQLFDSEIWCGRGHFMESQNLLSSESADTAALRLLSFDIVEDSTLPLSPFEKRFETLLSNIHVDHPFHVPAARVVVSSGASVSRTLKDILSDSGEGLVLRKPNSLYVQGRSTDLLKLKASLGDQEALVLGRKMDKSVTLQLPSGEIFSVPTENCTLPREPVKGDIVSFSYFQKIRRAVPLYPVIYRIRSDLTWEYVLKNTSKPLFLHGRCLRVNSINSQASTNLRLNEATKGNEVYKKFQTASEDVFPDIGLDTHLKKIEITQRVSYPTYRGKKRRNYLATVAHKLRFDPLVIENWRAKAPKILKSKKTLAILDKFYSGKLMHAVAAIFPEALKKDPAKRGFWDSLQNKRRLFEEYARHHNFDPLLSYSWYSRGATDLLAHKGMGSVLNRYNGNYIEAIIDIFPELQFDAAHFSKLKYAKLKLRL